MFEALGEDIIRYGEFFFCGDTVRQNRVDGTQRQAGERLRYQRVYKCPDITARLGGRSWLIVVGACEVA